MLNTANFQALLVQNKGMPYMTGSNTPCPIIQDLYFTENVRGRVYDDEVINRTLNANGINSAAFVSGRWAIWGSQAASYVCAWLDEHGFKADRSEIEAAVYQAFNSFPALDDGGLSELDDVDVNIAHWTLEQLMSFCELNGIPADNCVTREDYMDAIERGGRTADQPPTSAAESRKG